MDSQTSYSHIKLPRLCPDQETRRRHLRTSISPGVTGTPLNVIGRHQTSAGDDAAAVIAPPPDLEPGVRRTGWPSDTAPSIRAVHVVRPGRQQRAVRGLFLRTSAWLADDGATTAWRRRRRRQRRRSGSVYRWTAGGGRRLLRVSDGQARWSGTGDGGGTGRSRRSTARPAPPSPSPPPAWPSSCGSATRAASRQVRFCPRVGVVLPLPQPGSIKRGAGLGGGRVTG